MWLKFDILKLFRKKPLLRMYVCPLCGQTFVDFITTVPPADCGFCCNGLYAHQQNFMQGINEKRRLDSSVER
jgi:hypothetical protein